ncbi:glutathione S-transferase family protein [Pseudoxanthomonas sp. F37]|uniref:glutathione S-transferase family protein n=1 Tax=Pseudoxanthomonas TaxID=83618 RepID=UPI001FD3BD62|nr:MULTISPECIES: glutathione S-transferase family protein [Pseudoxanthomonas]UOV05134.1 glutathione S-transferase family protein [Pseudoxanthomonas mexicana]UOV10140.1 glutathione S-transferase family protein [Pseudoxanthomonas sp. F37]
MSPDPVTVHGMSTSGNCHKVRLLLEQLGRPYTWVEVDSANGGTRTPAYLAKNPNGKVPMLERADGALLVESNAILCWLAEGSAYLPEDAWQRAQALSWLFFEQYSHEPYIAVARFIRGWTPLDSPRRAELPRLHERGMQALAVMEKHLAQAAWFTGPAYGVADIALFAYTHCAGDGGFDLAAFPHVTDWLARVRAQPGFVPMPGVSDEVAVRLASP